MAPAVDNKFPPTTGIPAANNFMDTESTTTATTTLLEATAGFLVEKGSLGLMKSRGLSVLNWGLRSVAATSYDLGLEKAHGLLHL